MRIRMVLLEVRSFMANQEKQLRQKKAQIDARQRQIRRNQIIIVVFSGLLILSMILSLVINL